MRSSLVILLTLTVILVDAGFRPAFSDEGSDDDVALVLFGTAAVASTIVSGGITLYNRHLLNQDDGNAVTGFLGVVVSVPTVLLGVAVVYGDISKDPPGSISGWSLVGLTVCTVGTLSSIYGLRSIRESHSSTDAVKSNTSSISPAIFKADGQHAVGAQMTIRF